MGKSPDIIEIVLLDCGMSKYWFSCGASRSDLAANAEDNTLVFEAASRAQELSSHCNGGVGSGKLFLVTKQFRKFGFKLFNVSKVNIAYGLAASRLQSLKFRSAEGHNLGPEQLEAAIVEPGLRFLETCFFV